MINSSTTSAQQSKIRILRYTVLGCLVATTLLCGFGAYFFFYNLESKLDTLHYESVAQQLADGATKGLNAKLLSLISMSTSVGTVCPHAGQWPNCSLPMNAFLDIADPITAMADMRAISFAPIIGPNQVTEFEAYAYNFFQKDSYEHLGISDFGKGVYSINASINESTGLPIGRYHDVMGRGGGQHNILAPVFQISDLAENAAAVMFNLYSEPNRINAIDTLINCFSDTSTSPTNCTVITDIIHLVQDSATFRPASIIFHPIVPQFNKTDLVGIASTVHNWDTILSHSLPEHVDGVMAVLHAGESDYSFLIVDSHAVYIGLGDRHDDDLSHRGRHFSFDFVKGSVQYSLSIYPTDAHVSQFRTAGPIYASVIAVATILFTSLIFLLYDYFMGRSVMKQELVINTRRLFVRYISHEMRTPLNTVHLGMKLLTDEMSTCLHSVLVDVDRTISDKLIGWIELITDIKESSNAVISVLNDLINYDKLVMGTLNLEMGLVNLWVLITSNVKPFFVQAKQASVNLDLQMSSLASAGSQHDDEQEERHLMLFGDSVKLGQVIKNLVSNAVKFTPPNGTVTITAQWYQDGLPDVVFEESNLPRAGSLVVEVADTGVGISKENITKMFSEGVQFNANLLQAGGGSGLGLWISKGVVDSHHGLLSVTSEGEGKGATFRLELPLLRSDELFAAPVDEESLFLDESTHSASSPLPLFHVEGKSTILVVDDSAPSRKMVCRLLQNAGYICYQANDGKHCLDLFDELTNDGVRIDLILMDYEMPILDGPSATEALRQRNVAVPIIGVTGNVLQADKDFFIDHGANDVLHKPLGLDMLQNAIETLNVSAHGASVQMGGVEEKWKT